MSTRNTFIAYILVATLMICGAMALSYNLSPLFDRVDAQLADSHTMVMDRDLDPDKLKELLLNGDYITDTKDAAFISSWYKHKLSEAEPLEYLDQINGKRFRIPADTIKAAAGSQLNARLASELVTLGQDSEWAALDKASLKSSFSAQGDSLANITVAVTDEANERPVSGITVRLTEHRLNTDVPSADLSFSDDTRTVAYTVTDAQGRVQFNVPKGKFYSVLPIRQGYEYGNEKGTVKGALTDDLPTLTFIQKTHSLRPFSPSVYRQLRNDRALIVRTPATFESAVHQGIALFLICWAVVFVSLWIMDRRSGKRTDTLIPLSLMILSGIGLLALYGTSRPLSDTLYAQKMAWFASIGALLMTALSAVNYLKLYQRYQSLWVRRMSIGQSTLMSVAPGLPFLILAVILLVMLRFFGSGPAGSDARVNLGFFQPSEVVKYLILIFLVIFFVAKGDVIRAFGARMTKVARHRHWAIISIALIAIVLISLLFLGMLKDMGPGLVILATFILLYSIVRRDFPQLMLGIISYMIVVGLAYILTPSVPMRLCAVGLWFVLWIVYGWVKSKTIYESAIFFNALISIFLVGGYLIRPFLPGMADRLFNRTNMAWSGIFDNMVPQGDQIAQGIWGTASGGLSGMGIGAGSSYMIPAGHTDLILSSIGEQMGWLGLLIIAVCFFILVTRTTSAAQYSGHKFTLYTALGLGLLTGVQFLFIALGTVGAIPLSGVPVPFLSYSGTSIVMALAAYGVVLSISRHRGSKEALKAFVEMPTPAHATPKEFDRKMAADARSLYRNLLAGMLLFFLGVVVMLSLTAYYQLIVRDQTMLRPSITSTDKGLRVLAYNPRISRIIEMLDRGNIYDRNGLLLASSDKQELKRMHSTLVKAGLQPEALNTLAVKHLRRYYPFGNNMVFMVGDINRPEIYTNFSTAPIGYLAENANENRLRGFQTNPKAITLSSDKYKYNRFLDPASQVEMKYMLHDYSVLLPALNQPVYRNKFIEDFNSSRKQRDLHLTADARLQTELQRALDSYISTTPALKDLAYLRASVVVLDAGNGDLLCSANYPLPDTDSIVSLREQHLDTKGGAPSEWRPGSPVTERDLGLTYQTAPGSTAKVMSAMAAFKKLGKAAYDLGYDIYPSMSIEPPSSEPNHNWPSNRNGGRLTYIENAIKHSSNCYFVMSVNEQDLYNELGDIYQAVGVSLGNRKPYFFSMDEMTEESKADFVDLMSTFRNNGLQDYSRYMKNTKHSETWDAKSKDRMTSIQAFTGIAWGQSQLDASPLNMARIAAAVGNGGKLVPTRFVLEAEPGKPVQLIDSESADLLASAMRQEAGKWFDKLVFPKAMEGTIAGKTGTPMRVFKGSKTMNDGWYICFITNPQTGQTLSIALRLERLPEKTISTEAVKAVADAVIPSLRKCGYL